MFTPELLSPAGSLKSQRHAFAYGADAVYAGLPRYSLRVRNNEFDHGHLKIGIDEAHALGKQFYVACNIAPHNRKLATFIADIAPVVAMNPDAFIMSDPGLIMMVREQWPELPIHLSVQANAVNWAAVKFWQQQGLTRVILSRELSLDEIAEIKQRVPEMEIEVFVHGALCIAYSGRCLLSGYFNHRDPNQGTCTNACRWKYSLKGAQPANESESSQGDSALFLEESARPGELMPIDEDEHGTYIMNSKDLRAIQHIRRFIEIGVNSLKIEGRTKSHYYVARTAQLYRRAINDALADKPFDLALMDETEALSHRGYTEGFYRRHVFDELQHYESGHSQSDKEQFVGEINEQFSDDQFIAMDVKNRFDVGDEVCLLTPQGNHHFRLDALFDLEGNAISCAPGNGHTVRLARTVATSGPVLLTKKLRPESDTQPLLFREA